MEVAIGIDTHKGSLGAASVDALGRVLGGGVTRGVCVGAASVGLTVVGEG